MKQFVLIVMLSCSSLLSATSEWDRLFKTFKRATDDAPDNVAGKQLEDRYKMQRMKAFYRYLQYIGAYILWQEFLFRPRARL